ncbi:MAG: hypothetical protein U1E62_10595 [Alsobacter sp.]
MRPAAVVALAGAFALAGCQTPGEEPPPAPGTPAAIKDTCAMGLRLLAQTGGWQKIAVYEKMRETGCFQGPAAKPTAAVQRLSPEMQRRDYESLISSACLATNADLASGRPSKSLDLEDIYTAFVATHCIGR